MKTIKKTIYISLLCLAVVFTGCSSSDDDSSNDDDNGGGGNNGGSEFFTAPVADNSFEASTDPTSLIGAGLSTNNGLVLRLHKEARIMEYLSIFLLLTMMGLERILQEMI